MSKRSVLSAFGVGIPLVIALASACSSSSSDGGSGGSPSASGGSTANQGGSNSVSGGSSSAGNSALGGAPANAGAGGSGLGGAPGTGGASHGGTPTVSNGGAASGGAKSTGQGGAKAAGGGPSKPCENVQCLRAIECVEKCGGPVISSSCCPCENGTFDNITCRGSGGVGGGGAGGNAGAGGDSSFDLATLNTDCVNDSCPSGLTPVKFYGVAGSAGPQFCWCTIPCASSTVVCPSGSTCRTIADGPGKVCSVQR